MIDVRVGYHRGLLLWVLLHTTTHPAFGASVVLRSLRKTTGRFGAEAVIHTGLDPLSVVADKMWSGQLPAIRAATENIADPEIAIIMVSGRRKADFGYVTRFQQIAQQQLLKPVFMHCTGDQNAVDACIHASSLVTLALEFGLDAASTGKKMPASVDKRMPAWTVFCFQETVRQIEQIDGGATLDKVKAALRESSLTANMQHVAIARKERIATLRQETVERPTQVADDVGPATDGPSSVVDGMKTAVSPVGWLF